MSINETGMKNSERQEFWREVDGAPVLDVVNDEVWSRYRSKNDPGIIEMARSWARLMQARIDAGADVHRAASETYERIIRFYQLDGIGDMRYLTTLRILEYCWPGGSELRHWHTSQFGV